MGVVHRLAKERQHPVKALEGLVDEHISLTQLLQNRHARLQLARP